MMYGLRLCARAVRCPKSHRLDGTTSSKHEQTFSTLGERNPIVIDKMNLLEERGTAPFGLVYAPNKFGCKVFFFF